MTRLQRKPACKRGHVNPERTARGACVPCGKLYRRETYQRDRERRIRRAIDRAAANPDARRDEQRAWRLGVSVGDVRRVIAESGDRCGACSTPLVNAEMCVDHDHATGALRGVLCRFCNALEGMLNKQAGRVEFVQAYLARYIDREIQRLKKSSAR